jgi:hypothetical protein
LIYAVVYFLLRRVHRLIAGSSNEAMNIEVELVVLRYQLTCGGQKLRSRC